MVNPNPLATSPQPATAGTKLSIVNLGVPAAPYAFSKGLLLRTPSTDGSSALQPAAAAAAAAASIQEHPSESEYATSTDAGRSSEGRAASSDAPMNYSTASTAAAPAFGEGNTLVTQANAKDAGKRRKPKNNMTKSNSSFISRVIVHETLSKRLQDRPSDGLFALANINRAFQWLDMSSDKKVCTCCCLLRAVCCCLLVLCVRSLLTDRLPGRLPHQDPVHQGALPVP